MKLKTIDLSKDKWDCGGKTFYKHDSLSFNRYRELQRIAIEFGFSRTFIELYKSLNKAEEYLNKVQLVDAAVEMRNAKLGVASLESKDDPSLRLCALFINEADEDVTVFDETKIKEKIDCWAKELDVVPFFHLAASLVHGWMPAYKLITQLTSLKEKKAE
jgi:hypothetical protein